MAKPVNKTSPLDTMNDAAVEASLEIGPASRALEGQPSDLRAAATKSIRDVLAPLAKGNTVPLAASIWIVTASAS